MQLNRQDPETAPSLQTVALRGMAWTGGAQFVTQAFSIVTTIVLPRFLQPSEFGVVAMANIVVGLINIINGLGLGAAIIQKPDLKNEHLNSVFVANLVLGTILCALLASTASAVAVFYNTPQVEPVLIVLSLTFLMGGLSATHGVLLSKQMQYRSLALIMLFSAFLQATTAVTLAVAGYGSWALVVGQLISSVATSLGFWVTTRWVPRLEFNIQAFGELFKFGVNVLGATITGYASANIDNLVVGKFLGSAALGYYDLAFRWAALPRQKLLGIVHQVMFPAFSTFQNDNQRLRLAYTKLLKYISLLTFPASVGLMIITPDLIRLIYTDTWALAVVPLQILCGGSLIASIGFPMGIILKSKGRPDLEFKMTIISILLLGLLLLVGLRFGLIGVALAVSLKSFILIWLFGATTNRLIELDFSVYLGAFRPASRATLIMAIMLILFQSLLNSSTGLPAVIATASLVLLGFLTYVLALKWFEPAHWVELIHMLERSLPRLPLGDKVWQLVKLRGFGNSQLQGRTIDEGRK